MYYVTDEDYQKAERNGIDRMTVYNRGEESEMQRVGRSLFSESQPKEREIKLPFLYKLLTLYYTWRINKCNKKAEKFGRFTNGTYQYILWYAATSERASFMYKHQALIRKAEYLQHVKEMKKRG